MKRLVIDDIEELAALADTRDRQMQLSSLRSRSEKVRRCEENYLALLAVREGLAAVRAPQDGIVAKVGLEAGDTLRSIAETRGITLTELLFYNPSLNPYGYKKGDVICVPADINDTAPAQPDTGDLSTPPLPDDNAADDEPAQPGEGPDGLPMPTLPDDSASDDEPAQPGVGPDGLPMPTLPSTPVIPFAPPTPIAPNCPNGTLYTVQAGDTLRRIAQRFDVTLIELLAANPGQTNARLVIGQQLCIPRCNCIAECDEVSTAVRVTSTDFADYLVQYNISYAALSAANPGVDLTALVQGQRLCIPPAGSRGSCADGAAAQELGADTTAAALAQQLGISLQSLMMANPTFTPTDFLKGRLVCIPVRA